jgi:photosystem II stability/assembly factor-like uncharacterized protein
MTWHETASSLRGDQASSVTAVVAQGRHVFAGLYSSVLSSYDDGEHWQLAPLSSPPPRVMALALSTTYSQDGVIAAGTAEDGVFMSTDRGLHWTAWNFGLIDHAIYAVAFSPGFEVDGTIFAGTDSGLFRSRNKGRGWHELPFPVDAAPILSLAVSPDYVTDGILYAGTEKQGLFVSDDFGVNWRPVNIGEPSTAVQAIQMVIDPAPGIWLLLEDNLLCSSDAGHSWKQQGEQIPPDKQAMTMLPLAASPGKVLVGFADGDILPLR